MGLQEVSYWDTYEDSHGYSHRVFMGMGTENLTPWQPWNLSPFCIAHIGQTNHPFEIENHII